LNDIAIWGLSEEYLDADIHICNYPPMSSSPSSTSPNEVRFSTLIEWERQTRERRPSIRDEVRENAYDKAVDALLGDNTLGCDSEGHPSVAVTRGLANQCLRWKLAEDVRGPLTPDGAVRPTPRAAQSLDVPIQGAANDQSVALGELVHSTASDVVETVHYRLQLQELHRRLASAGALTRAAVVTYEIGADPQQVANELGVSSNAVHQAKSRFVRGNGDLA
jgi:hypothetical protein